MTDLYRHFDAEGVLLYVGISQSALVRLLQHREFSHWYDKIARIEIQKCASRKEALAREELAIKIERPLLNIKHAELGLDRPAEPPPPATPPPPEKSTPAPVAPIPDRLLNQEEAASYLGVGSGALAAWRKQGIGPGWLILGSGRTIRFRLSELNRWATERT